MFLCRSNVSVLFLRKASSSRCSATSLRRLVGFVNAPAPSRLDASNGDEDLSDRSALDGRVCGRRVFEAEAVEWQPTVFADAECAVFNCLVDVRGGGSDPVPA